MNMNSLKVVFMSGVYEGSFGPSYGSFFFFVCIVLRKLGGIYFHTMLRNIFICENTPINIKYIFKLYHNKKQIKNYSKQKYKFQILMKSYFNSKSKIIKIFI
jgi:hypothetical protein